MGNDGKMRPEAAGAPAMMMVQVNIINAQDGICAARCYGIARGAVVLDVEFQAVNAEAAIAGLKAIVNELYRRTSGIALVGGN